MNTLISVIIPVYNSDINFLRECIGSVLGQIYTNYEIIIIDDCSTSEEVLTYLDSLLMQSDSIKIIHLRENRGIAFARNCGIECSRGEWICFLDHDDFWKRDYLSEIIQFCHKEDTDMIVAGYQIVNDMGKLLKYVPRKENSYFIESPYWIYSSSAPWNRLIRRSFLLQQNIRFPEGCLTEDITFNITCNMLARNPIGVDCHGYCNRLNQASTSRSRKFIAMNCNEMPFDSIEAICKRKGRVLDSDNSVIYEAAICEQLTLLTCIFCRESDKNTRKAARQISKRLIQEYIPGYIKSTIIYNSHMVGHRTSMKMIQLGYMIAIRLHIDSIYCGIVHVLLKSLM